MLKGKRPVALEAVGIPREAEVNQTWGQQTWPSGEVVGFTNSAVVDLRRDKDASRAPWECVGGHV